MSSEGSLPSGAASGKAPKESRRWLKPRVPKEQLYRLSPRRPKPKRLGRLERWDWVRRAIRAWWIWLALAIATYFTGHWGPTIIAGVLSFFFYHTTPESHPAVYALQTDLDVESPEFPVTMAGMTGMPLVPGNQVALFNNGDEFFPAMLEAVESAEHSVTMEQYIFWDGRIGRRFAEAFAEKARSGVPVKLLLDAVGSSTLGEPILEILEAGGCQLAWFRPIHWYTIVRGNHRNHRKALIVDGRTAFTGGAGLGDHWLGKAKNARSWRDIMIRVEGPAASVQQSGFAQNWLQSTGEILTGHDYFPVPVSAGDISVQTILSSPFEGTGAAGTMHLIALQCARRHLHIANPYFIPDARVIDMLAHACRRGVAVQLMVAGEHNDTWWARQNSLRLYGKLLEAGVEIFEFQPTMLHQKIIIVDDAWASVGTANFDNRSLALNEETSVCFHDRALVNQLHETFLADLERCRKVQLARWKRRGFWQRAGEQFASLLEDQTCHRSMHRFRIATYNIHKCRGVDGRVHPERIARVLEEVNADIVSLQEVVSHEGAASADHQADFLAGKLGLFGAMGETRKHRGGAYGNVTLSRWDFKLIRPIDITIGGREQRLALRTDIRLGGHILHVFNVHLGTAVRERRQQAIRLVDRDLLRAVDISGPRIVLGDFNEWVRGLVTRTLVAEFHLTDLRTHLTRARSYPALLPLLNLDHIYFDHHLRVEKAFFHRSRRSIIASDHLPLVADLILSD